MADSMVRVVGTVHDTDGAPVYVGVDFDTVAIVTAGKSCLTHDQAEEFARLFVASCWQAADQRALMEEADRA